jgi:hypothetical protein
MEPELIGNCTKVTQDSRSLISGIGRRERVSLDCILAGNHMSVLLHIPTVHMYVRACSLKPSALHSRYTRESGINFGL